MRAPLAFLLALAFAWAPTASGMHAQQAGTHATSFDHKTGNEWWVEVIVAGSPTRVESRDDGGAWVALEKKSWGAWAKSYHIEPGHRVQFRASWSDGASVESCWFTHPQGVEQCPTTPPPPPPPTNTTGAFTFTHGGGNEWWVEVKVSPMPGKVEAMDTGGAWVPLSFRSWGEWANSFHIEPGNQVRFRAFANDTWHESCWFTHPAGVSKCGIVTPGPSWPVEGSYVRYLFDTWDSVPGYSDDTFVWLNYTYGGGKWSGTCEGWREEWVEWNEGNELNRTRIETRAANSTPPVGNPRSVQPGQQVALILPSCESRQGPITGHRFVDGREDLSSYHGDEPFLQNGTPVTIGAWVASYEDDGCPCEWSHAAWHPDTGLLIEYVNTYRYSGGSGHLVDTDAPIRTSTFPPRPAWMKEGTFVEYRVNETDDDEVVIGVRTARFLFTAGAWQLTCSDRPGETFEVAPPMGPTTTQVNATVRPTEAWPCQITPPAVVVQGKYGYWTTKNGVAFRANVWWGDESPETYGDEDARWDVNTGLLLEWEDEGGYNRHDEGYVINTNAPLAAR